jgi:putative heme-binding domain-containing protein
LAIISVSPPTAAIHHNDETRREIYPLLPQIAEGARGEYATNWMRGTVCKRQHSNVLGLQKERDKAIGVLFLVFRMKLPAVSDKLRIPNNNPIRWAGLVVVLIAVGIHLCRPMSAMTAGDKPQKDALFERENLVAWCIVPFDAKKRTPDERAGMLSRLGFSKFAYDYRAEHIPTFEAEVAALKRHDIELTAWWFPTQLNDEARGILAILKRHNIKTQLWVMGGGEPTKTEDEQLARVTAEAARIRPLAEEAAKIGCRVGLYNHGGWFGEPENQIAIIDELKLSNVGIVYNLHHGHEHLDRFPKLLQRMLPYLYALNLNGMMRDGARRGLQILPLGQGELDLELLKTIRDSGYHGPIGILGHTQDDAEARLRDNLEGLDWLVKQLDGHPAGQPPVPRTYTPPKASFIPSTGAQTTQYVDSTELPKELQDQVQLTACAAIPVEYDKHLAAGLATDAAAHGDIQRGMAVFCSARFACLNCHQVGRAGGGVGPALTDVGRRLTVGEIVESLLWPRRQVKPEFSAWQVVLSDGRSLQGYKRGESAGSVQFFDAARQQSFSIDKADIEEMHETGTLMPDGLTAAMTADERRDLIRFLQELGHTPGLEYEVRAEGTIAEFTYDRAPLDPAAWPLWQQPVNRDRLYDFYTKQALYFRDHAHQAHLLPAFPGLDGGTLGHWGNQNEETWKDDRWNRSDLGTVLSGVFRAPGIVVPKGVCIRLGDNGELATCFNPETLSYEALWRGGFLKFSAVRHGFLDDLRPDGDMLPRPQGGPPQEPFAYHGFYRVGPRIVFAYRIGDVEYLDSPWVKAGVFERVVAPAEEHPLRAALSGGPPQWPQILATGGERGSGRPYAVDTIELPFDNPWHALLFATDHDFLPDGSALVCTMQGDVWRVTGLDENLTNIRWRRFASGLNQPLGLVVSSDEIYVLGRDQITRLHDLNEDGETDFYECFSNKFVTSPAAHDFICGLARDPEGRFYTASGSQGLLRISADGQLVDVLATGFRNPDGVTLLPDNSLTLPCSEGDWTPASMICLVPNHETAGATPHFGYGGPRNDKPPSLPLVYLPRGLDNSSGGQTIVPDDRWGPMRGQLIHFSFGQGSHFLVLRDKVDGQPQGAVVPLAGEFRSGAHRGKFNPSDGQLYVSGMAGWGTYTQDDGCFQRVRYTGEPVQLPRSLHVHENGILLSFTQPVDGSQLARRSNHFAQVWNYRYGPGYGSAELAPSHPGVIGHERLDITAVHEIDPITIFVELPALQPVNQLHLLLQVDAGRPQELFVTVHHLDRPFTQFDGYRPVAKTIAAHPISIDLSLMGKAIPNPWIRELADARRVEISAGQNLSYSTRTLRAKPGERLCVTLKNPDVVSHNWVLIKPDALARVGALTNKLVADPDAVLQQYVPRTDDVLAYTDIVPPRQQFSIYFEAPQQKGRYPYLCTFPGHWMVMNGDLIIE